MTSRTRISSLLWTGAVVLATALSLVLMLQVKAVNSEIAETEKAIVSTQQQIAVLETEFQTRARQQQLVRWNEVDFGYVAPRADQFLDGRAQLAALGKQVEIIEDEPIRMAEGAAATMPVVEEAAPVRTASAADSKPALKGEPEKAANTAKLDAPVRLAQAPAMMRQLVAVDTVKPKPAPKAQERTRSFAERFDIDTVIAEGRN
ncbi:hypothetical protein [Croceicoccus bisphenolivorans]|uniref:hypothetical protein n=1 Tax=Croceicoccus bisphenolivorans TaxID=1783232 RepID=UPI00082E5C54|nr:hypothetical protein [Croceicoccus bisphenolivorans]